MLGDLSGTTFTLTPSIMATINGGPLADGKHTLTLLATDSNGNLAAAGHVELHPGHDPAGAGDAGAPGLERHRDQRRRRHHAADDADLRGRRPGRLDRPALLGRQPRSARRRPTTARSSSPPRRSRRARTGSPRRPRTWPATSSAAASPVDGRDPDAPPTTPTLALAAASQTVAGEPTQTTEQVVTLTGTTSPGAYVTLFRAFDPDTPIMKTQADSSGDFAFSDVALAPDRRRSRWWRATWRATPARPCQSFTTTAIDTSAPVITAGLADDTGVSSTDGITSDPTITGVVDDPIGVSSFRASLDGGQPVDVTSLLTGVGFTSRRPSWPRSTAAPPFPTAHTLSLQATDSLGHASSAFAVSFTLQSAAAAAGGRATARQRPHRHEPHDHQGPDAHRGADGRLGTIVTLYMNGDGGRPAASASTPARIRRPRHACRRSIPLHGDGRDRLRPGEPVLGAVHRHGGQHATGDLLVRAGSRLPGRAVRPEPDDDADRPADGPDRPGAR